MEVYLVGGAVRDELLQLPVKEKDWVVVNSTPEEMKELGYQSVGKSFPVFLHPKTKEEYALARQEKKVGMGYYGFECNYAPNVTLEEDLSRRDLTINAIAKDSLGQLIDPFNGQKDIQDKLLRHVSSAFVEDPVRLLRIARFASQFNYLGFSIAPNTMTMLKNLSDSGELNHLVPERIWAELNKSLVTDSPWIFFKVLEDCDGLKYLFPELNALSGVPNAKKHHPEVDSWVHTLMVLKQACLLSKKPHVRFAALVHDIGKGQTPSEQWPKHPGHEQAGLTLLTQMGKRLRIPNSYMHLAKQVTQYHGLVHSAFELNPDVLLDLLLKTDAIRKTDNFEDLLLACLADSRGRLGYEKENYPQREYLKKAAQLIKSVDVSQYIQQGLTGQAIATALRKERVLILTNFKNNYVKHN